MIAPYPPNLRQERFDYRVPLACYPPTFSGFKSYEPSKQEIEDEIDRARTVFLNELLNALRKNGRVLHAIQNLNHRIFSPYADPYGSGTATIDFQAVATYWTLDPPKKDRNRTW